MSAMGFDAKKIYRNPSMEQLRDMTAEMPNVVETKYKNLNTRTRVVSRSKDSTFLITDEPEKHDGRTIHTEEGRWVANLQNEYMRDKEMIVIDGYIGNDPTFKVPVRQIVEKANANLAAMQKTLYFPPTEDELRDFKPTLTVIYTPNLEMPEYPDNRLIAADLASGVTRIMESDYFGESKKSGLRMWNQLVYERGGLPLHAGCKSIPVGNERRVGLIVGLSGTGKTTTTFTRQNDSGPVQDDFVALMPGGKVHATENGCFAKTFALDPKDEPTIHGAVLKTSAYLENVSQNDEGELDFFDTSYTQNGRAVFPMSSVDGYVDARTLDRAHFLLILNWNENIIPAVARLDGPQAAAYFMLGETKGTSAGGAAEAGKSLRVPGTNPFWPLLHVQQGNRLLELMESSPLEVYLMNTGRVGGKADDDRSRKVTIPHSSAIVKAIAEQSITWEKDPDFGYEVATAVPDFGAEDADLLKPRARYQAQGRLDEYNELVARVKADRAKYMEKYSALDESVIQAIR